MKIKKIINLGRNWSKIGSWKEVNPYVMHFLYFPDQEPMIVKGGLKDCESYLLKIRSPYIDFRSIFHHGKTRGDPRIYNLPRGLKAFFFSKVSIEMDIRIGCDHIKPMEKGKNFRFTVYDENGKVLIEKDIRRIPRRFPNELTNLISTK